MTSTHWTDRFQVLFLSFLLMFGILAFGAVEVWGVLILRIGTLLLLFFWAGRQIVSGQIAFRIPALLFPYSIIALVVFIQIVFGLSQYSYPTTVEAMKFLSYAILIFLTANSVRTEKDFKLFALAFSFFGASLALFALVQDLTFNGKLYWIRTATYSTNIFGPYVNRNHYAGAMEMLAMIPLALCWYSALKPAQRLLLAFSAVLMISTIFISQSRGGAISTGVALIFFTFTITASRKRRIPHWSFALFFLGLVSFLLWVNSTQFLDRWNREGIETEVASGRWVITKDAMEMVKERPILGYGLGTFPTVYPKYRSFYTDKFVNEAHNDYIQLVVETGLVGGIAMMWFLVILYRSSAKFLFRTVSTFRHLVQIGTLSGCTAMVVHSLVDFNLHIPANAALFFCFCAVSCIPPEMPPKTNFQAT